MTKKLDYDILVAMDNEQIPDCSNNSSLEQPLLPYFHEKLIESIPDKGFVTVGELALKHGISEHLIRETLLTDKKVRAPFQDHRNEYFTSANARVSAREVLAAIQRAIASRAPY